MNVTLDTLEIRHVTLPPMHIEWVSALLILTMSMYIVSTIVSLVWHMQAPASVSSLSAGPVAQYIAPAYPDEAL